MNKSNTSTPLVADYFNQLCEFGGRLAGSKSEQDALAFARNTLASLPQGELRVHQVEYDGWRNEQAWIEIDGNRHTVVALPCGTSLRDGGLELEVVDAGRGTPNELRQLESRLTNRAVLVTHEYMFDPEHIHRCTKAEVAHSLGAAVFVIASPFEENGPVSGGIIPKMPAIGVDMATGKSLRRVARDGLTASFVLKNTESRQKTQTLDWLLQTDVSDQSAKEVIVCAHIDGHAAAESALDNASGVAVALSIAIEAAKSTELGATLRVLIFSAEEFGFCGSQDYVAGLTKEEKSRIKAVINLDCVAGSLNLTAMTSGFKELDKLVSDAATDSGIVVNTHQTLLENSDHHSFAIVGIPALRLIAGFGEPESKLRNVLTGSDKRDLVTTPELENALAFTRALVRSAGVVF